MHQALLALSTTLHLWISTVKKLLIVYVVILITSELDLESPTHPEMQLNITTTVLYSVSDVIVIEDVMLMRCILVPMSYKELFQC